MATAPDMQHAPSGKSKKSKKNRSQGNDLVANNATMSGAVGGASTQATPTRQLEFNQAMADFKTMFPSMDRDVIETVLRANNGAVDATIDQLLTLTADMPETPHKPQHPQPPQYGDTMTAGFSSPPSAMSPVTPATTGNVMGNISIGDQPPPYSPPSPNSPFSQEMRGLPLTPAQRGVLPTPPHSAPPAMPMTQQAPSHMMSAPPQPTQPRRMATPRPTEVARPRHPRWNPPLVGDLPPDFLRVGGAGNRRRSSTQQAMVSMELKERMERNVQQQSSIDANDVEMQRLLEDERFALTLQNEEFMRELQLNPEFIAALDRDYIQAVGETPSSAAAQVPMASPSMQTIQPLPSEGAPSPLAQGMVESATTAGISSEDVEFRNKLSHMGKTTRYKFAQMAKKFNYRKKKSSTKSPHDGVPASSMMNLLDDYDESGDSALLGTRPDVEENFYIQPAQV